MSGQYARAGTVIAVVTFNPQTQLTERLTVDKEGNIYVGFYNEAEIWKMARMESSPFSRR